MVKHLDIKVSGRVQGVAYRFWAMGLAGQLKISGYAQNAPDGSVFIEAEGEEKELKEFVESCKSGPPLAKVEKVEVKEGKIQNYAGFEAK